MYTCYIIMANATLSQIIFSNYYQAGEVFLCFFKQDMMFTCSKTYVRNFNDLQYAFKHTHRVFKPSGSNTQLQSCHTPMATSCYLSGATLSLFPKLEPTNG